MCVTALQNAHHLHHARSNGPLLTDKGNILSGIKEHHLCHIYVACGTIWMTCMYLCFFLQSHVLVSDLVWFEKLPRSHPA